jgi:hypothetical protein
LYRTINRIIKSVASRETSGDILPQQKYENRQNLTTCFQGKKKSPKIWVSVAFWWLFRPKENDCPSTQQSGNLCATCNLLLHWGTWYTSLSTCLLAWLASCYWWWVYVLSYLIFSLRAPHYCVFCTFEYYLLFGLNLFFLPFSVLLSGVFPLFILVYVSLQSWTRTLLELWFSHKSVFHHLRLIILPICWLKWTV